MIPPSEVLKFFTLYCSANILNDLKTYEPNFVDSSSYYFRNSSDTNAQPRAVRYDPVFENVTFFPKCCPPHAVYDTENKNCIASNDTTIYEFMKITTDFIRNGLSHCPVVGERIIQKRLFMRRSPGKYPQMTLVSDKSTSSGGTFCLDKTIHADYLVMKLCDDRKFCERPPQVDWCVSKCCWDGYNYKGRHCRYTSQLGLPVDKFQHRYELEDNYAYLYGLTNCSNQRLYKLSELNFIINRNGALIRKDNRQKYEVNEYCMDSLSRTDTEEYADIVMLCESKAIVNIERAVILLVVVLICACFIIALLKSVLIYELNEWVTKVGACYCSTEIIFWILTIMRLNGVNFGHFCTLFAYSHFGMSVSRLAWLNVLSYEVSRIMGKTRGDIHRRNDLLRFMCYVLYAVTVPGIVMVVFITSHQKIFPLPEIFRPQIDIFSCAVHLDHYGAVHALIAIILLISINVFLYGRILCCRYPKKTGKDLMIYSIYNIAKMQHDLIKSRKTGFLLLKLALVNVITWIYYWAEYSHIVEGDVILDNVGNISPR